MLTRASVDTAGRRGPVRSILCATIALGITACSSSQSTRLDGAAGAATGGIGSGDSGGALGGKGGAAGQTGAGGATGGSTAGSGGVTGTGGSGGTPLTSVDGGTSADGSAERPATDGAAGGSGGAAGGSGGVVASGGTLATGGVPGTGGTIPGTGGTTSGGTGGGATSGRRWGACTQGAEYPQPALSGSPRQIYKATSTASGTFEGPVWLADRGVLLFSDITFTAPVNPSQILQLTPPSTVTTLIADAGVNGIAVGAEGLLACSHKVQGIVRLDPASATLTTVLETTGGKKFNSPNDLTVRSDGTIYFTDPDFQLGNRVSETGKKAVYRASPSGAVVLVDDTFTQPNGIALSPDEAVLYVADYGGNAVRRFTVSSDGSTSGRSNFATVTGPDGFAVDCAGNLYVASGSAVQVFAPTGTKLGSLTVASSLSNMAFGGPDGKTLYITAGKALYAFDMNLPGYYD